MLRFKHVANMITAIAIASSLVLLSSPALANTQYQASANSNLPGLQVSSSIKGWVPAPQPKAIEVSDAYAIQMVTQLAGSKLASHMVHRITKPNAEQYTGIHYTPANSYTWENSSNWGGYSAQNGDISGTQGDFNVAPVSGGWDATWVGIGGVNGNKQLLQTGIDQKLLEAWYELFPAAPVYLFNVKAGDEIGAGMSYNSSSGEWFLYIVDQTLNTYYANDFFFSPDRTTADWIDEAVSGSPVGNYGSVNFTNSTWLDSNGSYQNINSGEDSALYGWIVDEDPGGGYAAPSAIGSNGQSFSISGS